MKKPNESSGVRLVGSNAGLGGKVMTSLNIFLGWLCGCIDAVTLLQPDNYNEPQSTVFVLGICPKCHKKGLRKGHASHGVQSKSCACGLIIFEEAKMSEDELVDKWLWKMDYCKKRRMPPAQAWAWELAEKAFFGAQTPR